MSKAVLSEAMIQASIIEYLAARHIFALRLNSGTMMSTYKGKSYRTALCAPGTADILAFPHIPITLFKGENRYETIVDRFLPLWLEVKSATGKQTPVQKSFQRQVEDEGHKYVIVRSIEDVAEALR